MKKIITIAIIAIAMNSFGQAVSWQWAKSASGSTTSISSVIDNNGNYYAVGYFTDSIITIDTFNLINPNPCCTNNSDMFMVKYNSMGDVMWVKGFSFGKGSARSITIDNHGFLFIIGNFNSSTLTIDGITINNSGTGTQDIYFAKLDTLGNLIWLRDIGGTSDELAYGITSDGNYIYLFGSIYSPSVSFGTNILYGGGSFIAKYTPFGGCVWAKTVGTIGGFYNGLRDVEPDGNGNIYATGSFGNTSITFDTITLYNSGMSYSNDMYIVKYDASGNVLWAKSYYYGFGDDESGSKIVHGSNGNFYVLGYFDAEINLGSIVLQNPSFTGSPSMFIAKFDSMGNPIWAHSNHSQGRDLAKDSNENIYLIGGLSDTTLTFGSFTLTTWTSGISYLAKYDSSGTILNAEGIGGGGGNNATAYTISLDNNDNIFISGTFSSPNLTFGNTTLTNPVTQSMYVAKSGTQLTTSIKQFDETTNITVAPNPTSSKTTITFSEESLTNGTGNQHTIIITDVLGKEIKTINFTGTQCVIEKGEMERGIYFVKIIDEKKNVVNKKIVIQ